MHFEDLTPYSYRAVHSSDTVLNVGWLGAGHEFPVAPPRADFISALRELVAHPTNLCRGFHQCEFCPSPPTENRNGLLFSTPPGEIRGSGEVRVPGDGGITYAAPVL